MAAENCSAERVIAWRSWTPKLFSFRLTRPAGFRFTAGQFARLGIQTAYGTTVWRPYSMVSAPYDDFLEFLSIVVPGGEFTSELATRRVGDTVWLDHEAYGFLTLNRFPDGRELWLLATGTGVAPFLSMLQDAETWTRFEFVVLAYSVRSADELAYLDWLAALPAHPLVGDAFTPQRWRFIQAVTRTPIPGALSQRLTLALDDGTLEAAAGRPLSLERSRVMVCGNPQMVDDCRARLSARGFKLSRQSAPAQLAFENYW